MAFVCNSLSPSPLKRIKNIIIGIKNTVEPRYNEVLGTMKITLLYQVSHYIRVEKQRNIKSWDQQNDLVIRGFCYIRPLYNEVPLSFNVYSWKIMKQIKMHTIFPHFFSTLDSNVNTTYSFDGCWIVKGAVSRNQPSSNCHDGDWHQRVFI